MVNSSEKGFNCGYAKILKRNGFKELEKLKNLISEIDDRASTIKERIDVYEEKE